MFANYFRASEPAIVPVERAVDAWAEPAGLCENRGIVNGGEPGMSGFKRSRSAGRLAVASAIVGSLALAPVLLAGPVLATAAPKAAVKTIKVKPTLRVSSREAQVGERIWLAVTGLPKSATISVQQREIKKITPNQTAEPGGVVGPAYSPSGSWQKVGDSHKTTGGKAHLHVRVTGPAQYRIVVKGASPSVRTSAAASVPTFGVTKSLVVRRDESSAKLGHAITKVRTMSKAKTRKISGAGKKVTAVRWQVFDEGVVVEVRKGKKVRTWLALGAIGESYRKSGGPAGSWGVPSGDAKCGLLQSGCVQTFSARTAYSSTRTKKAVTTTAKGRFGEVDAALRSWLGFKVTYAKNKNTPIQKWMGSSAAWCGYFQTWGFHASGNADLLPPKKKLIPFPNMRETVKRTMKTSKKPKVGALAFVRTERGRDAGHVGLVTAISKTHIRLLHGNTGGGGTVTRGYRGVVETWLPRSTAAFYAYPQY
ncbi:hypothetical protein GCM10010401_10300 [Rarobacter faecitabidus]|uniref:Peptidase C51 domain-containing protein n=1 Tax=Rarobacter faecitabidus TaxID=13243 RepID=A0A542ZPS0_RARFA|nr:CHAP domain-containing protein [Rarobacter faecitabidus]TQL62229.1 hypothetical protein FB461_1870 [Rarobacter faecitabidus]